MPSTTSATTTAMTIMLVRERRASSSCSDIDTAPVLLDTRVTLLAVQAPLLRSACRLRGPALLGDHRRLADQLDEPRAHVGAVALLRAVLAAGDHQHAVLGEPRAGERDQPQPHRIGQGRRAHDVETQLYRRRDLVDVLPAGPGRGDE